LRWRYQAGFLECFEVARKVEEEAEQRGLDLEAMNPTYFLGDSRQGELFR